VQIADLADAHRVARRTVPGVEAAVEAEPDDGVPAADRLGAAVDPRRLRSIGFSQSTGLPAATACSM
jgi:hypothetical protein